MLSAVIPAVLGGIYAYWITFINPQSVLGRRHHRPDGRDGAGRRARAAVGAGAGRRRCCYLVKHVARGRLSASPTSYIAMIGALLALIVLFLPDGLVSLLPRAPRHDSSVRKMLVAPATRGRRRCWRARPGGRAVTRARGERSATAPSAGSRPSTASVSRWSLPKSSASSARTAAARARCSTCFRARSRPTSGTIRLDGRDVTRLPAYRIARAGLGRTFQIPALSRI